MPTTGEPFAELPCQTVVSVNGPVPVTTGGLDTVTLSKRAPKRRVPPFGAIATTTKPDEEAVRTTPSSPTVSQQNSVRGAPLYATPMRPASSDEITSGSPSICAA